jgi:hypothetical protein
MTKFNREHFVKILEDAWGRGMPLAHNWARNPFPGQAQSIHGWCSSNGIDWGAPRGFPVQDAQRVERGQPRARIRAFQEPTGKRRIMFSLSDRVNPAAYGAAAKIARLHGFEELDP